MTKKELQKISQVISEKLGKAVEFVSATKVGSGYHSDGFMVEAADGKKYFLKYIHSNDLGFELPERKLHSLLLSQGMARKSKPEGSPSPVAVIVQNGDDYSSLPEIDEKSGFFQIQEFAGEGKDYYSRLLERKAKKSMGEEDKKEIDTVVQLLAKIHSTKHPSQDKEFQKTVYNGGIRSVLISPELTIMFLHDFTKDNQILTLAVQKKFIGLMLELLHHYKDRSDRLCALHGDFWGANVFFRPDGTAWTIDFSRIPWGDPGIDVGWWLSQYLWLYFETNNPYFKELGEYFLTRYEQTTGDKESREAVSIVLGLLALIYTTPRFYADLNESVARPFFNHVLEIMEKKKFFWGK